MHLKSIIILSIFIIFFSDKNQKQQSMTINRGFESVITDFNDLEKKLIVKVAKKLESRGFPLNQLTRIHLKKRILHIKEYYSYNEITFLINPGIYKQEDFYWGVENIGVDWEDPHVVRTPDGGIEVEVDRKVKVEELIMNLYRLQDSYSYGALLKNHAILLKKINDILLTNDLQEIKYFTAEGIPELIKNYHIILTIDPKKNNSYEMVIRRLDNTIIDSKYFSSLFRQYHLKINIETSKMEILDSFDPTFFPSPATVEPISKNKN